jgi:mono/diheme cytochrome c family protein
MRRTALLVVLLAGCDGWHESAEPPPPGASPSGSVARGTQARLAALAPPGPPVDEALLARGTDRYAIHCTPCHGARGLGDGPVVARGFPAPPPIGGAEPGRSMAALAGNLGGAHPFDDRLAPADRWAVAHFVARLPRAADAP